MFQLLPPPAYRDWLVGGVGDWLNEDANRRCNGRRALFGACPSASFAAKYPSRRLHGTRRARSTQCWPLWLRSRSRSTRSRRIPARLGARRRTSPYTAPTVTASAAPFAPTARCHAHRGASRSNRTARYNRAAAASGPPSARRLLPRYHLPPLRRLPRRRHPRRRCPRRHPRRCRPRPRRRHHPHRRRRRRPSLRLAPRPTSPLSLAAASSYAAFRSARAICTARSCR